MATVGLWPVKNRLKEVIEYAENPDKTTDPKYLEEDLYNALKYAENDDKTDKRLFVAGINCPKQRAYEAMMAVKRCFGKTGGTVAWRGALKNLFKNYPSPFPSGADFFCPLYSGFCNE